MAGMWLSNRLFPVQCFASFFRTQIWLKTRAHSIVCRYSYLSSSSGWLVQSKESIVLYRCGRLKNFSFGKIIISVVVIVAAVVTCRKIPCSHHALWPITRALLCHLNSFQHNCQLLECLSDPDSVSPYYFSSVIVFLVCSLYPSGKRRLKAHTKRRSVIAVVAQRK